MPTTLQKLTPNQDLQCFFYQPAPNAALSRESCASALSSTSSSGFTLSGTWRQQFDWSVIEWNRDNVYEHPALRSLPDGDLSGLTLSYQETRTNTIPIDSDLYATVDWPSLRVWATPSGGSETIYYVPLLPHATAIAGSYQCAYADFTLSGMVAGGDYIGLAFLEEHYTYQLYGSDTLTTAVQAVANSINAFSTLLKATVSSNTIRVYYTDGASIPASTAGANGNRFGVYSYATGAETWDSPWQTLANGTSPTEWQVTIDFATLQGTITPDLSGTLYTIPINNIRKMRWTYAADLQAGDFARTEYQVVVSNWTVTGTNRGYSVAGPGSRRVEDNHASMAYAGTWTELRGNFSGGTIAYTSTPGDSVSCTYNATSAHTPYLGLRYTGSGATVSISVDGGSAESLSLRVPGEDVLFRYAAGPLGVGSHSVSITHAGPPGADFYFDFIELALPATTLPTFPAEPQVTLATDWDTLHSISLAPERTAWLIDALGFKGRANHYIGALWFYELAAVGYTYASATVTFSGTSAPDYFVTVTLGQTGEPSTDDTVITKLIHEGDTADSVALAFFLELNNGYTGVWASISGNVLTIYAREIGAEGNNNTISASTTSSGFTATASGTVFTGGVDGDWRTDLSASPRLNRAVRDWTASFFTALQGYGIDVAASLSMELGNGDPSAAAGIAQCGPAGDPILLPTPSVQTNFAPTSLAFWQEAYAEIAGLQAAAGLQPYLQFGEVQWWYFPSDGAGTDFSGMPFYDAWTQAQFLTEYGHAMATITTNAVDPASYPDECAFLPALIGNFTNAVMSYVRTSQPTCRFEVLYPTDVNQTAFNIAINYPVSAWTPSALNCLKTECFGFTLGRNLNESRSSIDFGSTMGFPATQSSHLVGVGDSTSPWLKEARTAMGKGFESVVLFALDQFCLIGYADPLPQSFRRSVRIGG